MNSLLKNFLLGVSIGLVTIIMLFVMFEAVVDVSSNTIQLGNTWVIILIYGCVTALLGRVFDQIFAGKKKKK